MSKVKRLQEKRKERQTMKTSRSDSQLCVQNTRRFRYNHSEGKFQEYEEDRKGICISDFKISTFNPIYSLFLRFAFT